MNDLIYRQEAIDALKEDCDWLTSQGSDWQNERMERDINILQALPSAQPERKEGRWVVDPHDQDGYCSECKCDMPVMMEDWCYKSVATLYCPSCGAKMG